MDSKLIQPHGFLDIMDPETVQSLGELLLDANGATANFNWPQHEAPITPESFEGTISLQQSHQITSEEAAGSTADFNWSQQAPSTSETDGAFIVDHNLWSWQQTPFFEATTADVEQPPGTSGATGGSRLNSILQIPNSSDPEGLRPIVCSIGADGASRSVPNCQTSGLAAGPIENSYWSPLQTTNSASKAAGGSIENFTFQNPSNSDPEGLGSFVVSGANEPSRSVPNCQTSTSYDIMQQPLSTFGPASGSSGNFNWPLQQQSTSGTSAPGVLGPTTTGNAEIAIADSTSQLFECNGIVAIPGPGGGPGAIGAFANPLPQVAGGIGEVEESSNVLNQGPFCLITEQPTSKQVRFCYESDQRKSAGSIPGINSTPQKKTFPSIKIKNYEGNLPLMVQVSCVTKNDTPNKPHPHSLLGENCKDGVFRKYFAPDTKTISFPNLGVLCMKRNDFKRALDKRQELQIDPFNTGFSHKHQPRRIDLNSIRLCFQVFIVRGEDNEDKFELTEPVVSNPIFDRKARSILQINSLSDASAPVDGGKRIILLCEKVIKGDITVRLFQEANDGRILWDEKGEFQQVYHQVAIQFNTPPYKDLHVIDPVQVWIQLLRPSDEAKSKPLPFQLTPNHQVINTGPRRKRAKAGVIQNLWAINAGLNQAGPSTSSAFWQLPPIHGASSSFATQDVNPVNMDPANMDPANMEPANMDPANMDPANMDPANMDPANMDPANIDPANMDPANMDPANMDPTNMDPANMDPANMDFAIMDAIQLNNGMRIILNSDDGNSETSNSDDDDLQVLGYFCR